MTNSIIILCIGQRYAQSCYAEWHYAEWHYAECHYAECRYAACQYAKCRGADAAALLPSSVTKKVYSVVTNHVRQENCLFFSLDTDMTLIGWISLDQSRDSFWPIALI